MDLLYIWLDKYKWDYVSQHYILLQRHKTQHMGLCIFDYYMLCWVDSQNWPHILVYKVVGFQGIQGHRNILLARWFLYIDYWVRKETEYTDSLRWVL